MESMSLVELAAAILGIACVTLGALRSIWNYAFGVASVVLLCAVFYEHKLYSDALLQIFFAAANLYGLANWRRSQANTGTVVVETMTAGARVRWALGCAVAVALWGWLMHRYTDASYPWPDAAIAIVSAAAQILMARRRLENWLLWIAVDLGAIPLYGLKQIWITMGLYVVYLGLAIWGFLSWRAVRRVQRVEAATA